MAPFYSLCSDYEGSDSDSPSLQPVLSQHRLNKCLDAAANGQRAAHGPARHPGADDETPLHIASHDDDSDHANDMEWEQADTNANAAVDAFDTQAQAETDFFALLSDNDLMADFASLQTSDQRFLIKDRASQSEMVDYHIDRINKTTAAPILPLDYVIPPLVPTSKLLNYMTDPGDTYPDVCAKMHIPRDQ